MDANPNLLPHEIHPKLQELLNECSALVLEQIAYGTHLLTDAIFDAEHGEPSDVVLVQFRNMLELMDGVQALIRAGSVDNTRILIRTFVEQFIQYTYLIREQTQKKTMWYKYMNTRREWKWMKRIDPDTKEGKEFRAKLERDPLFPKMEFFPRKEGAVEAYEKLLASDDFRELREEYERLEAAKRTPKHWYSLFDGPRDLSQLADRVNMSGSYEMFYRRFSESVHGNDVLEKIKYPNEHTLSLPQLRKFDESSSNVLIVALTFLLVLYKETINQFRPSHMSSFAKWYVEEIQQKQMPLLHRINSIHNPK